MGRPLDQYRHISFDLDGTLVHTLAEYRYRVVPETIKKLGGIVPSNKIIDKFWFEPYRDKIIVQEFKLDPDLFWRQFNHGDAHIERAKYTFAYPDAEKALRKLKDEGKVTSIITGSPANLAKMEIQKLNDVEIDYYLSVTDSHFAEKPAPEAFYHVFQELRVSAEHTLYVGNSNEDAAFAKNAGVDFIYLERKEHDFENWDWVTTTIHSLDELFGI